MAYNAADEVGVCDDWPTGFAQVPDWITLHPELKAQSVREYAFLAMHAPKDGRRRVAFPGQASIARCLQLGRSDKVTPYTRALEAVGAVRVEEIATPKGRAYRYVLRFNPPAGYTGPTSLSDFYGTREPEVDNRWAGWSMTTAPTRDAGQQGSPQKEGDPSPGNGGNAYPPKAGSNQTSLNQTSMNNQTAPSARSANDARRATTGSSGCEAEGGSAAANSKTRPSRIQLTRQQAKAVAIVEQAIPETLTELLPSGKLSNDIRAAIVRELACRTPEQLAGRVARRWVFHGYQRAALSGQGLRSPFAVAHALVRPGECPDPSCEDGVLIDTKADCRSCEQRQEARRRDGGTGPVPAQRSNDREGWVCRCCERPGRGEAPESGECAHCWDEARAAVRRLLAAPTPAEDDREETPGLPADGPDEVTEPADTPEAPETPEAAAETLPLPAQQQDTPEAPAGETYGTPNAEYLAWREARNRTLPAAVARARADKAARQEGQQ